MMRLEREIRLGLAALGALGGTIGGVGLPDLQKAIAQLSKPAIVSMLEPSTAYADELLKPPVFQSSDGRNVFIASFDTQGQALIVSSNNGLEFFNAADGLDARGGLIYGGKVKVILAATIANTNIGVRQLHCGPGPFIDVISNVGGSGYMDIADNARAILANEMKAIPDASSFSSIGLLLQRDAAQRQAAPDLMGGSKDLGIREEPGCVAPSTPAIVPVAPVIAACTGALQVVDVRGVPVMGVDGGVKSRVTGSFDLADHFPFASNLPGLSGTGNPLRNVLGEPGAFLADRDLIARIEPGNLGNWDSQVAAGMAEYLQRGVNFFELQTPNGAGLSVNPSTGQLEFRLSLPKHVIVRIDAEEANVSMVSASGDRNVRLNLCQAGTADNGFPRAAQGLFIRSPYEQASTLVITNPTVPGTEVQVFGMKVKNPTAFASANAFLQGVQGRQANPDVSRYLVETFNINDMTLGAADSEGPGVPFQPIEKNY